MSTQSNRWGYIDRTGKVVIDFRFDHAHQFTEGFGLIRVDDRAGFVDKSGTVVISPQFRVGSYPFFEGLAMVWTLQDKFGYIDKRGEFVIAPEFEGAFQFSEGIARVWGRGGYGFIDKSGAYIVSPRFRDAGDFYDGHA